MSAIVEPAGQVQSRSRGSLTRCHAMRNTLLLTFAAALALQVWRPFYHLTDDSLSAWLAPVVEIYRKLWTGHWPLVSDWVFGGGYDWLGDGAVFSFVSPYLLFCSPLALTPFYYLLPDVVGTLILLTTAGAFCGSALFLRSRLNLEIPDNWVVFLSLSYTFTVYALVVNASWIMFINVHAAYPVAFAALFARSFWRSASVIAATVMFSLLGAHPHPFCYLLIFGGLLALGVSCVQRSWRPAAAFALGSTIATIAMLPLIIPVLAGFATSWRHGRMDIEFVRAFNLPWDQLVLSWISGPADLLMHRDVELHYADPVFVAALAWSLVNLPLLLTLLWRRRRFSTIETVLVATMLICAVFIVRPLWLATALSQVPFLRSLRWPFREIAVLNACTHLLAVFCLTPKLRGPFRVGVIGSAALASVFLFYPAPTFNPLQLDRTMIISGKVAEFQRELARIYGPERRLMISSARHLLLDQEGPQPIPFAAMGAYNYASLFRVVNIAGYSSTIPHTASPEAHDLEPIHWAGIYSPEQANRILAANPDLLHLTVTSLDPLLVATARGPERHLFEFDRQSGNFHEVPVTGE